MCVQPPAYHGSARDRLTRRFAAAALAGLLGFGTGACSMSMQLGEFFSDKKEETVVAAKSDVKETTGAIPSNAKRKTAEERMDGADWTLATAALREALAKGEEGSSIPWQNLETGTRGTVTPVANAFVQEGFPCRNFLASHVGHGRENWFEGTACRVHRGQWDVRTTRPLLRKS